MLALMRVVGVGLMATVLLLVIREERRDLGLILRLGAGVVILLLLVPDIARVVAAVIHLSELAHIPSLYLALLLKVVGISYLTVFVAQLAQDAGEAGTGMRVELAGKLAILVLAIPLIASITETVLKLIPS
ncbi:MAG: stage III sporulation protein AD [Sulfobacillus acidophilus]|uniref:Stage III sporulation protein AD n=1 Tax=Sulfobacillus acidophilus TaxID=53633 RepID=A0A2T2WPI4_9FIRM|nr:MAG: stage III sporulation protein AD [Sulfobacillus acidophilus]